MDDAPESLAAVLQHDYQRMMAGGDPLQNDNPLQKVQELLNKEIESLATSRTAKLWLQYMTMVNILKEFIKAERTGNFQLHLEATHEMLPYFCSSRPQLLSEIFTSLSAENVAIREGTS